MPRGPWCALLCGLLCLPAIGATQAAAAASAERPARAPNILLIQADDLGYGDLGSYGETRLRTPALDALAADGMRFTQYYAGSAVCAPSRASLMTGLHTGHTWIRTNGEFPLRDSDFTMAELLKQAGYRTAVIGKWGLGTPGSSGEPNRQGFDYAYGFLDHRHAHRQYTDHLWRNGKRVDTDVERDYVNDLFTREAAAFIAQRDQRPFFVYLNYTVPHPELRAPEDAIAPFRGKFPERAYVNARADATPTPPEGVTTGYRSQPTPNAARAGMIARMDRDIGRLRELLRKHGLSRDTLVLFVSDNGPNDEGGQDIDFFGSRGGLRGKKRELYDGGIRVPMIASWPAAIPRGRVSDQVAAHWDLLPTLAEAAGLPAPEGGDGISMLGVLRGQPQVARPPLYWEFQEDGFKQALRDGPWKLVRPGPDAALELYRLDKDPGESRDVSATHPEIVRRLRLLLASARHDRAAWPEGGSRATPANGTQPGGHGPHPATRAVPAHGHGAAHPPRSSE